MKKFILFALILMCMSCSKSIEDEAMEHLKIMMKEMVNCADEAELVNTHTVYKSDSLCVIDFTLKAPNGAGAMLSTPMEYLYIDVEINGQRVCGESITFEDKFDFLHEQSEEEKELEKELAKEGFDMNYIINNSVANVKSKYRNELIKYAHHNPNHPKIEDKLTFSAAWLKLMTRGREVNKNKGKDIKL
ncbi:MAG: hypothetical protein IJ604_07765 [Prevotella sp.]|nr:hypothetical protein [Prevotella sp.]